MAAIEYAGSEMLHHALIFVDTGDRVENGFIPVAQFLDNGIVRPRQERLSPDLKRALAERKPTFGVPSEQMQRSIC